MTKNNAIEKASNRIFVLYTVLVASVLFNTVLIMRSWSDRRREKRPDIVLSGPPVQYLEKLAELVTLKCHISDILEVRAEGVRGVWLVKGDALTAIDISKAQVVLCDETKKYAIFRLPPPRVISPRVDHEKTRTYDVQRGMWVHRSRESSIRDDAMRQAQQLVEHVASSAENMMEARHRAESMMRRFYDIAGWRVDITWADTSQSTLPDEGQAPGIINPSDK